MTNVLCLLYGRQLVEHLLPIDAIASEGIDGKVANAKRCQVLEEVGALTWVDLKAVETSFYNDLRGTDMRPLHRNAQPRVTASPTTWTDEEIRSIGVLQERAVDALYLFSNCRIVAGRVALGLDVNDVFYVCVDAVTYCRMRPQETVFVGNHGEVFVEFHSVVHHRSYL